MMLSPVSDMGYSYYGNVGAGYRPGQGFESADGGTAIGREGQGRTAIDGRSLPGDKAEEKKGRYGFEDPAEECQTCKERKYKDGSDEMVSFKSPRHVSPENAASAVRAHEQEHVSNAYKKAAQKNGKVVNASVSIQTSVCPECGRNYVSGGVTNTMIKYSNEDNPYTKNQKQLDAAKFKGANIDYAA